MLIRSKEKSGVNQVNGRSNQRRMTVVLHLVESPVESQYCSCCSHHVLKSDTGTQSDVTTNEAKGKSRQKIIRITMKYQKKMARPLKSLKRMFGMILLRLLILNVYNLCLRLKRNTKKCILLCTIY